MTDYELVQGCLRENAQCQRAIFERYSARMMSVSLRYARNRSEAEDVLQEAFIKVFDNIEHFKFKGSLEGWIRRIVVNTALRYFSRKSITHELAGIENLPEPAAPPSAYSRLGEEELMRMINQLPDGYRLVFNMYAIEGYNHKEISEMLGIKESTSRSQLVKARKLLQSQLEKLQRIAV